MEWNSRAYKRQKVGLLVGKWGWRRMAIVWVEEGWLFSSFLFLFFSFFFLVGREGWIDYPWKTAAFIATVEVLEREGIISCHMCDSFRFCRETFCNTIAPDMATSDVHESDDNGLPEPSWLSIMARRPAHSQRNLSVSCFSTLWIGTSSSEKCSTGGQRNSDDCGVLIDTGAAAVVLGTSMAGNVDGVRRQIAS